MKALVALAVLGLGALACVCLLAGGALYYLDGDSAPCTGPNCPPSGPCPGPGPCPPSKPQPPRKPWRPTAGAPVGAQVGGPVLPNGTELNCDLPGSLHQKNTGGSDGAGLCVFASARHTGLHQNEPSFAAIFDYMKRFPGGGYPQKFDKMLDQLCKEKGLQKPKYIQVQGSDIEILKLASKTGRMPAVTYGHSPTGRYGGGKIAHMVSLPHADDAWFTVLDNNYIGEDRYEHMSPREFLSSYTAGGGGWSIILLDPAAPPAAPVR